MSCVGSKNPCTIMLGHLSELSRGKAPNIVYNSNLVHDILWGYQVGCMTKQIHSHIKGGNQHF